MNNQGKTIFLWLSVIAVGIILILEIGVAYANLINFANAQSQDEPTYGGGPSPAGPRPGWNESTVVPQPPPDNTTPPATDTGNGQDEPYYGGGPLPAASGPDWNQPTIPLQPEQNYQATPETPLLNKSLPQSQQPDKNEIKKQSAQKEEGNKAKTIKSSFVEFLRLLFNRLFGRVKN